MRGWRAYLAVAKPSMVLANVLTAAAGFMLAARGRATFTLAPALLGTALVAAAACAVNNLTDREIDRRMPRTRNRPLATGTVSAGRAMALYGLLGGAGVAVLAVFVNWLTVAIGTGAFLLYTVGYALAKRRSAHATVIGALPGAASVAGGYCAVRGRIDATVVVLFVMLALWQIPHFAAIAIYRGDEYRAAGLPAMRVAERMRATKLEMVLCMGAFLGAAAALTLVGGAGITSLVIAATVGAAWLALGLRGFRAVDDTAWGRRVFRFSLVVMVAISVSIGVGGILP